MARIRRLVAALLAAVLLYGILGSSLYGVFAAETPVNITVDKFENGTLDFRWSQLPGAKAAVITYNMPDEDDDAIPMPPETVLGINTASISGLEADYIYDIRVTIYGAVDAGNNPTGSPIGRGLLFYLPAITFYSTTPAQAYENISGGGREIGGNPKLKLSWKIPKVFDGINKFIPANKDEALSYMESSLDQTYFDNRDISALNYRINVSTELNLLNSGSAQAALLIEQQSEDIYTASVSGKAAVTATVTTPNALEFVSFELWGRADDTSEVPTSANVNVLPDKDILPGTVYYMNIKPIFKNSLDVNVAAVTVGNPITDQNGSLLSGERSYTSTPIRFQLTKDSANNIYVKIYKVNEGSLDLPRLYYEVQVTDDPSIQGDWTVKKTMDDSYFSGTSAVTVITGVNPNNEVYYKIVVKSDSPGDRLESPPMPYTLTADSSKPPLPTGIALVDRSLKVDKRTPPGGMEITVKSTDVTLSWDKPLNWGDIKNNLYFHFLLNTSQAEIATDVPLYVDGTYWGSYPAKYRLIKYISAANVNDEGNRLTYTIKAFDLFTWKGDTATDSGDITGNGTYPAFLIPNTVYYLQMYTTTAANRGTTEASKMSDKSILTSFTTLNGVELDVPLPMSFSLDANGKDTSVIPALNYIELKLDKVTNIDWNNYTDEYNEIDYSYETYYDIYMNSRTDTDFILVGSTEVLDGDVGFTGADDLQSTSIKARISQFTSKNPAAVTLFGDNLLPNTTYYFKAATRLVIRNRTDVDDVTSKSSINTAILPVTTIVLVVTPPDDSQRKPLAPSDFDIAVDANQNLRLDGSSVTFTWVRQEDDVLYELIRTTQKVGPTDLPDSYIDDPEYISFLLEYDTLSDGADNEKVYLDPAPGTGGSVHPGKFTYDHTTKICTYTVDRRMFPNKLYYFSLKTVRVNPLRVPLFPASESVWVSIPVTTSLIETPTSLEVEVDAELGFHWMDSTAGLTAEDYKIYVKGPSNMDYKLMTRSRATIVKDKDGRTYYGRLTGLKVDSYYDIRVTKGVNTPVFDKSGMKTRDGYHELEIKWVGKPVDNYSYYEIALMTEGGSEYTVLSSSDLEQYVDKDGAVLPYYTEETAFTVGSDALYYHARIKSAEVLMPGGIPAHLPLQSNVKYYIKVRAVKIDPTETDFIAYSKYIGPVITRTEFNQDDYDNTDREEQQKAVFLDRMKDLEKGYFWRIAIGGGSASSILLKGDRVADALKNSSGDSFTVDMTAISLNMNTDVIYVPVTVIKVMNSLNKSLVFRTSGSELLLRPATLNASGNEHLKELLGRQEVKDLYVKLVISHTTAVTTALPSGTSRVSNINELDMQAFGLNKTDSDLKNLFHDKLYDEDSGLVSQKLNMLQSTYVGSGTGSAKLIDQYTKSLVELIEKELSAYIDITLQSVKLNNAVRDITTFDAPVSANLTFSISKGVKLPYVLYDGAASWQKITKNTVQANSSVRFDLLKTGKFVILTAQGNIGDVPAGHWAESYIMSISSKYDLSDVFAGINNNFMPENKATCKEVVLLYEKLTGKALENASLDIRQKNVNLGLDGIISVNSLLKNVKKQETAAVLMKLFSVKKGVNMNSLKPGGRIDIADEYSIGEDYFNSVLMIVDIKVMNLDGEGNFSPGSQMTRAEVVAAFARLLQMLGDL